jgi:hypothetical protein
MRQCKLKTFWQRLEKIQRQDLTRDQRLEKLDGALGRAGCGAAPTAKPDLVASFGPSRRQNPSKIIIPNSLLAPVAEFGLNSTALPQLESNRNAKLWANDFARVLDSGDAWRDTKEHSFPDALRNLQSMKPLEGGGV